MDFDRGKIMSTNEHDVKNDSDNNLGNDFDYEPNAQDDAEDDDVDSLDSTSRSEQDVVFVMRKDDVDRDKKSKIICRQLVCNKEGWMNMRYLNLDDRSREARSLTRTKCPARLRVNIDYVSGRWKKGGYRHAGFIRKDLYNYIDRYCRSKVKNGDANATINYLIDKSNNDPLFFGKHTFTNDKRLEYIFWADGQSIVDYNYFGDIVAFDSTYKKNKYNKTLVIFSRCNYHGQTVISGFGLLSDETTDTYKWLLEMFVEAMGEKSPKAVITDGDLAMRDAIKNVLPAVTHRLCGWHLQRNACENIKNPNTTTFWVYSHGFFGHGKKP
ncbi:protein FAR1-RELATED SEQUENCE 5-like [Arachis stenosperma]|uniref:protein FAR1-RELATED SEQUENCE 5-like n=1 Tax=Arachis stenosperma TaxID=217475 RepID=UPI0025AC82C1|nr:protein FAR1-RELATED SEQUENCE 5-like [Arachis stenosperma]